MGKATYPLKKSSLNQLKKEDIDWLVPHQANIRILEATAKKLESIFRESLVMELLWENKLSKS